ncbi:hypothetical protein [Bythopirellula goksoeyrii]|uniref:Magnetosome protein MamS/MamX domain-containing protein n=1 Tax=Bythopirellula goksoeyrii TaxID=1400387 RepID=A0A5B9QDC6_9BACT|nr:hypothetical protein [Bythopirellula goksoeyrii]QEG37067.1 hypothetical protein Pr1d_44070 [Bythopirellula goksoeyrii]
MLKHIPFLNSLLAVAPVAALCFLQPATVAEEWEQQTPYYEDDAWYDVSEWLDGNDYNPTDETIGEWDDETYNWDTSDSDANNDQYGYDNANSSDDWFYDYSDDNSHADYGTADESGRYSHSNQYYDYDKDGYYDATSSQYSNREQGLSDGYVLYLFTVTPAGSDSNSQNAKNYSNARDSQSDDRSNKQARNQKSDSDMKKHQIKGQVQKTKKLQVRKGPERLIAQVSADQGKTYVVDLGRADQFHQQGQSNDQQSQDSGETKLQVKEGDQISSSGPMMKVGDKHVLVAQTAKIGNQNENEIDRSSLKLKGEVSKVKTTKIRGHECQLAILKTDSGKKALVDLGPKDELDTEIAEGDQIQVSGIPVKVKDRSLILAKSVTKDGEQTKIDRVAMNKKSKSSS